MGKVKLSQGGLICSAPYGFKSAFLAFLLNPHDARKLFTPFTHEMTGTEMDKKLLVSVGAEI